MKRIVLIATSVLLFSCGSPVLKTVYSNPKPATGYKRILVIAIMPGENTSLEREIENTAIRLLDTKGYVGVAYPDAIKIYDTSQPCLDAFYFSLEEKNIDGILTISQVRASPAIATLDWKLLASAPFYFDHIWKYKDRQVDRSAVQEYMWESILFDLHSLETNKILQCNYPGTSNNKKKIELILQEITSQMGENGATPVPSDGRIKKAF